MPFGGLLTLGIIGASGAIGGSAIGAHASKSAAKTQATAAQTAANEQAREFDKTQANEAPWLEAGKVSLQDLMNGLKPGGQFSTPYSGQFNAPTLEEAKKTPGYEFARQLGEQGILHGQASSGGAFSTGTLANLAGFNDNLAQTAYQQTYNNAKDTFATHFNTYNTNQANLFNRLASTSGLGQTAATQLGQLGQESVQNQGNLLTSGAAAQAAGQVGAANAYTSGISGLTNGLIGQLTLQQLMSGNRSSITPVDLSPKGYDPGLPGAGGLGYDPSLV